MDGSVQNPMTSKPLNQTGIRITFLLIHTDDLQAEHKRKLRINVLRIALLHWLEDGVILTSLNIKQNIEHLPTYSLSSGWIRFDSLYIFKGLLLLVRLHDQSISDEVGGILQVLITQFKEQYQVDCNIYRVNIALHV